MRQSTRQNLTLVRTALRENRDGLTTVQIAEMVGIPRSSVHSVLNRRTEFYIDRFEADMKMMRWVAVWCAVTVPEDAPEPVLTVANYLRTQERRAA